MSVQVPKGYKQTEVGVIPEDWVVRSLGEIATIKDGTHQTPKYQATGVPFYSVEHVTSGDFENTKFISEQEHKFLTRSFQIEKGDILMTRIGSIGDCKLIDWDVKASFYVSLALLKIKGASAKYISQYSNSSTFKKEIELHSLQHATPKKINLGPISDVKVALPKAEAEQQAIAEALSDADALIESLEQLIAKKRQIKQGAMQELLTGQRRLPGFSGEWIRRSLDEVADVIDPHPSHRAPNEVPNGIPFLGIGDFDEYGNIVGKKLRFVDPSVLEEHAVRYCLDDALIGLGRVASIGKVVSLKKHDDGYAISPTLGVIRGRDVGRDFLIYSLKSIFVKEQFLKIMSGSTRSSVGMQVLRELIIELPPSKEEQNSIATFLKDMDYEIKILDVRLDKARQIKQSMMQELLTGHIRLI